MKKDRNKKDNSSLLALIDSFNQRETTELAEKEMLWWRKDYFFQNEVNWNNPFWVVKQRFYGPLVESALNLYGEESAFRISKIAAEFNSEFPQNLNERERKAIQDISSESEFFCTTSDRSGAIRIYFSGINEAWKKLPQEWHLPKDVAINSYRAGLKNFTDQTSSGNSQPGHYFRRMLDLFFNQVTRHMQSEYEKYLTRQKQSARLASAARWGEQQEANAIIERLAQCRDALGDHMPAKELWPEFFSALDELGLDPKELGFRIIWDGNEKGITLSTFSSRISRLRNS